MAPAIERGGGHPSAQRAAIEPLRWSHVYLEPPKYGSRNILIFSSLVETTCELNN